MTNDCGFITGYDPNIVDMCSLCFVVVVILFAGMVYTKLYNRYIKLKACDLACIKARGDLPIYHMAATFIQLVGSVCFVLIMIHWIANSMSFVRFCKFHLLWTSGIFLGFSYCLYELWLKMKSIPYLFTIKKDEDFIQQFCTFPNCDVKQCCDMGKIIRERSGEKKE